MTADGVLAAIYARQSKGSAKSVDQQQVAAQRACDDYGWKVTGTYTDLISASRFARKQRRGWGQLLADLEAGEFGVIVLWEASRGDRSAASWITLLETCRARGVRIHVVDDDRTYDLRASTSDWHTLAQSGVASQHESEKTRDRIRRDVEANAEKGRPHGGILYGYRRVYGLEDGKRVLLRQEPDPVQAPVVREVVSRIAAGEAVSKIAHDLDERGIKPARGASWNRSSIRKIAMNRAYVGNRRFRGGWIPSEEWFPLIADPVEFWQAEQRMHDRMEKAGGAVSYKASRPGSISHLLSYLITCGVCGKPMGIYKRRGQNPYLVYRCNVNGCASIREAWLDAYVTGRVCAILDSPVFWDELMRSEDAGEARRARQEEAAARATLRDYRELAAAGKISAESFAAIEPGLRVKIEDAKRRAASAAPSPALMAVYRRRDLMAVRDLFQSWPLDVRREVITTLYESVTILPAGLDRKLPDRERIVMVRRKPGAEAP